MRTTITLDAGVLVVACQRERIPLGEAVSRYLCDALPAGDPSGNGHAHSS